MEIFTERFLLKDVLPDKAKDIAKEYKLKVDEIEFIRKRNPLKAEDLKIEDGERAAIRYINTADLDRDSEIVMPSGGQVNDFKKSPTVLYAHDYQGLPIGKDIWLKLVQGKGWLAKTVYAKHQLASDVYNLVKEKFLNTSSIGFIPLESVNPDKKGWDKARDKVVNEYGIKEKVVDQAKRIYTKWLLLEHSDCPIPSNPSALNIAVGKGLIEIKSQELIDDLELEIIDEEEDKKVEEFIDEAEEVCPECGGSLEIMKKGKHVHCTKCDWGEGNRPITKPEVTDQYIRIPVKGESGKHSGHKIRTITISTKEGIKALYCVDCKKTITYLFDKTKWDMAKAKKWMADHGKAVLDFIDGAEEELNDYENGKEDIDIEAVMLLKEIKDDIKEKEEPSKNFIFDEIYEIIKENKDLKEKLAEAELKAGAVLNKKNKADLTKIKELAQNVLDSAETAEPAEEGKEADELEIEEPAELEIEEKKKYIGKSVVKEVSEKELVETIQTTFKGEESAEGKEETFDISADEIKVIVKEALDGQADKVGAKVKEIVNDNWKRLTGKVM